MEKAKTQLKSLYSHNNNIKTQISIQVKEFKLCEEKISQFHEKLIELEDAKSYFLTKLRDLEYQIKESNRYNTNNINQLYIRKVFWIQKSIRSTVPSRN